MLQGLRNCTMNKILRYSSLLVKSKKNFGKVYIALVGLTDNIHLLETDNLLRGARNWTIIDIVRAKRYYEWGSIKYDLRKCIINKATPSPPENISGISYARKEEACMLSPWILLFCLCWIDQFFMIHGRIYHPALLLKCEKPQQKFVCTGLGLDPVWNLE